MDTRRGMVFFFLKFNTILRIQHQDNSPALDKMSALHKWGKVLVGQLEPVLDGR